MNKKLFKLLSISTLLASVAVPCVEGTKKYNQNSKKEEFSQKKTQPNSRKEYSQKKIYLDAKRDEYRRRNRISKNEFVNALIDMLNRPAFVNFYRYFKINRRFKNPVILKSRTICSQQKFNECFIMLTTAARNLNESSKRYCLESIEKLVRLGNRKGFMSADHNQSLENLRNNSIARRLNFDNITNIVHNQEEDNNLIDISDHNESSIALSESSHITTYLDPHE